MEPYWWAMDGDLLVQTQAQLESSAGEVWKVVSLVLAPIVVVLAKLLWNSKQQEIQDAKGREAQLNVLLNNAIQKKKGGDNS